MMISYEEHLRQLAAKDVIIGKLTTELTAKVAVISKLKIDLANSGGWKLRRYVEN
jgi:hypothetical protein